MSADMEISYLGTENKKEGMVWGSESYKPTLEITVRSLVELVLGCRDFMLIAESSHPGQSLTISITGENAQHKLTKKYERTRSSAQNFSYKYWFFSTPA